MGTWISRFGGDRIALIIILLGLFIKDGVLILTLYLHVCLCVHTPFIYILQFLKNELQSIVLFIYPPVTHTHTTI